MKLKNLDTEIFTLDGKPMPTSDTDKTVFTVRKALMNGALGDVLDQPGRMGNFATKLQRYDLYKKLKAGKDDFSVEDIKLLKDSVLNSYSTFVAGQVVDAIEG